MHKVNKLKQTINLKLLLESAGQNRSYLKKIVCVITVLEAVKGGATNADGLGYALRGERY
jgi:hypothetical protein